MAGGFGPFVFLAALGDPAIIAAGVATGLLARRWWHLALGLCVPPAANFLFYSAFYATDHFLLTLPFLAAAGAVWIGAAHAVGRAWRR